MGPSRNTGKKPILERHRRGLHYVATFEAFKGVLVLAVGLGLLDLVHADLQILGADAITHLGLNPGHSKVLLHALKGITQGGVVLASAGAVAYSLLRFVEAYGLWHQKSWGTWVGILSCGLYLPFEFYGIYHKFGWIKVSITTFNVLLLLYLIYVKFIDVKVESNKA